MDPEILETDKKRITAQKAMRLLQRNPTPEGSEEGSDTSDEQESVSVRKDSCDRRRTKVSSQTTSDRFGEELAPDAAIWTMYLEEAQKYDRELVEGRQGRLDVLLLFAALFSGILTIFLMESKNLLRQDPADASAALLLTIAQSQQRIELGLPAPSPLTSTGTIGMPEFAPSFSALWVNRLWFIALGLSLSTALIAMLGKEWLTTLRSSRSRSSRRLGFIRASISRIKGLEDWGALRIIDLLPTLLHLSLLLFSVGLVIYLWEIDAALAIVLAGLIGTVLGFYVVTGILGAVYDLCPFVVESFQCARRILTAYVRIPSMDLKTESVVPSIEDLQAILWLSQRTVDPMVVDSAYQAIAGLHQSPYIISELAIPRLNPISTPIAPGRVSPFDRDISLSSMLSQVEKRFDDLLAGKLETGNREPPVCRYINSLVALRSHSFKSIDAPPGYWLDLLDRINRLWGSSLPDRSLSGSNFAGVLIAQMDVLKLAMDQILPALSKNQAIVEPDDAQVVESGDHNLSSQHQSVIGRSLLRDDQLDQARRDSLSKLWSLLADWLEVSLALLLSHAKEETDFEPYLVDGLFRAISEGANSFKCMYPVLSSLDLIGPAPSWEVGLEILKILVLLLSQLTTAGSASATQLTEIFKTYLCIAPTVLGRTDQVDEDDFHRALSSSFRDLIKTPPTCRKEALYLTVRYMMISAGHICRVLPEVPEYAPIFDAVLELLDFCPREDSTNEPDYLGPRPALTHHIGDYVRIMESLAGSESNMKLINTENANHLCIIANFPWNDNEPSYGLYIPPSCFITLIRTYARSHLGVETFQFFMNTILSRIRSPEVTLPPLPALSPASYPVPEPRPSIEYLQQLTRFSGGFSALVKAGGSTDEDYIKIIARGIATIAIIAANRDTAFVVEPVELQTPAVPGFLEALSYALPRLSSLSDERLHDRFVVAASVLLVVACEDEESREQIATSSGRTKLLNELRDNKEDYLEIVAEAEWRRLVNGLSLGETNTEEEGAGGDESDQESEGAAGPTTSEVLDLDIN